MVCRLARCRRGHADQSVDPDRVHDGLFTGPKSRGLQPIVELFAAGWRSCRHIPGPRRAVWLGSMAVVSSLIAG